MTMEQGKHKIRIVAVDDHPIVIQGLHLLLANELTFDVVGTFVDGGSLLAFLETVDIDIALLDITLPDINGLDLCLEIKTRYPKTLVLMLSNHAERSFVMQAIQHGASGYLLKNASLDELATCIREALDGRVTFSREITDIITRPARNEWKVIPKLTKRETQILKLLATGKTSAVIAEELFLSPLTIVTHRRNLLQKFEVKNVAELVKTASEHLLL
ncbi:response regulator [Parapedobacter sp. DT-150]|uniref:response regulator n=1 Tax=Parapedobacter sp. DT-150 TaxID=3396162 RepID=UPI003F19B0DF